MNRSICKSQYNKILSLYIQIQFEEVYKDKEGILGSAQIPQRHGTHVHSYHQVNGLKCRKPHDVELSIRDTSTKDEMK